MVGNLESLTSLKFVAKFNNKSSLKYLNDLYIHARNRGLKSTYYLRNRSASKIEKSTTSSGDVDNRDTNSGDNIESTPETCSILDPTCESCQWVKVDSFLETISPE